MPGQRSSTAEREPPLARQWREIAAQHEHMVHALMWEVARLRIRLGDDEGLGLLPSAPSIVAAQGGVTVATVTDPKTSIERLVEHCRTCGADIYWSTTDKGKLCPFNVVDGAPTRESHFSGGPTSGDPCPQAKQWSKRAGAQ